MRFNREFTKLRRGNIVQENFPTGSLIPMIERGELTGAEEISIDGVRWTRLDGHSQLAAYFMSGLKAGKATKNQRKKNSAKGRVPSKVSRKLEGDLEIIQIELTGEAETETAESALHVEEIELVDEGDAEAAREKQGGLSSGPLETLEVETVELAGQPDSGEEELFEAEVVPTVISAQEDLEGIAPADPLERVSLGDAEEPLVEELPEHPEPEDTAVEWVDPEALDASFEPPALDERVQWKFREMSQGEMNVDPIESEFFSTDHLDSLTDALVRETIQNSLDAGLPGQKVRVRFRITEPVPHNRHWLESYLSSLMPHLAADKSGLAYQPKPSDPLNFLVIEDFGTRGLEGDPWQDNDLDGKIREGKNDFFYFWRNVGRSKKGKEERGRWGLGKTVFQAVSRINTFFGLTVRASDGQSLLMGQSVLKTHLINGRKHYPYGWYGIFEDDFVTPVDNFDHLVRFCEDLKLERFGKSGLSMVVPFPDPAIGAASIISSTLIHYFAPILSGDLVVDVVDRKSSVTIDKARIDKQVPLINHGRKKVEEDDFRGLLGLMRWAIDFPEEGLVHLAMGEKGKSPKWSEDLLKPHVLKTLSRQLGEGRPLALRVPMVVQKKGEAPEETYFDLFLQKDDRLDKAEDHFVREGITLAGVKSLRQKGLRVIVWVKDKALSCFLGDSENPAHTEWQERSPKFRGRYIRGPGCIRFVKNSPKEIVKLIYRPAKNEADNPLAMGSFDLQHLGPAKRPFQDTFLAPPREAKKVPPAQGKDEHFHLYFTEGGFKLTLPPEIEKLPSGVLISTAYETPRGNPFLKYSIFDFDMNKSPIRIKSSGARIVAKKLNRLFVEIHRSNFSLEVTGFDPNRDLKIKINPVK